MRLHTIKHTVAGIGAGLLLTLSMAPAQAAVCHTCEDPTLPPPGGGPEPCQVTWTSDPTISAPRVGASTTSSKGTWSGTTTQVTYQWYADSRAIPGAQGVSYTPTADQANKSLRLRVSVGSDGCTARSNYSDERTVALGAPPSSTAAPQVSGTAAVGLTLTLSNGSWSNPTPTSYSYRWLRNNVPVPGATASTYKLSALDAEQEIRGEVTARTAGYQDGVRQSAAVTVASNVLTHTVAPVITGSPSVGSTLSAGNGTWNHAPAAFTHQWLRDGSPIAGATSSSYVVTGSDQGHALAVEVTATRPEYVTGTATSGVVRIPSAPTPPPVVEPTPPTTTAPPVQQETDLPPRWRGAKPALKGKPRVGKVLRTKLSKAALVSRFGATKVTFQWFRGSKAIKGAKRASYRLTRADRGKRVRVKVTGHKAGHPRVSVRSRALRVRA